MRAGYHNYIAEKGESRYLDAVEKVKAKEAAKAALRLEAQELRLARIMNRAEPCYQNGHPKAIEKGFKK